jgi:cytochrome b561
MKHSRLTRTLHLLVAAAIVFQLASSQLMRVPRPGRPPLSDLEAEVFALHEYAGLVSMAIIALFWLWLLVRRRETSLGLLSRGSRDRAWPACRRISCCTSAARRG